ncbi:hypothetical protein [Cellvibrio sp. UBA7661]|uniref:hypothetical protein n=1 Tax=Cellvibrio sp. UBA7661 TaxID=1946311 RepID=UPI002F34EFA9
MKLITEIKQKNDRLLLQRAELQKQLHIRLNVPVFTSFIITFAVAPFIIGAVAGFTVTPSKFIKNKFYYSLFPYLKMWPLF